MGFGDCARNAVASLSLGSPPWDGLGQTGCYQHLARPIGTPRWSAIDATTSNPVRAGLPQCACGKAQRLGPQDTGGPSTVKNEGQVQSIAPECPPPACHSQLAATAKNRCPPLPGHRSDIARSVGWPVSMGALSLFRLKNLFRAAGKNFRTIEHEGGASTCHRIVSNTVAAY
jgi:hypothetical protein